MNKMEVYWSGSRVGVGYTFMDENGMMTQPELYNDSGIPLPTQQWYQLVLSHWEPVVAAKGVQ